MKCTLLNYHQLNYHDEHAVYMHVHCSTTINYHDEHAVYMHVHCSTTINSTQLPWWACSVHACTLLIRVFPVKIKAARLAVVKWVVLKTMTPSFCSTVASDPWPKWILPPEKLNLDIVKFWTLIAICWTHSHRLYICWSLINSNSH